MEGVYKPAETVHGDSLRGPDVPTIPDDQRPRNGGSVPDGPKPRPENPEHPQGPRPVLNQPPNFRPNMNPQMRPMMNHVGPGMPNQMRQPYPNQPRPPPVYPPPNAVRVDAPRPNNATGQPPIPRHYPPGQPFDPSQQNRMINPAAVRPPMNRPPMNPPQRPPVDNLQKAPNMPPFRPNAPISQNPPPPNVNPINQQHQPPPVRPPIVNPPTVDGNVRTIPPSAPDPTKIKSPQPAPTNVQINTPVDQNRNVKPPEPGPNDAKPNPEQVKPEEPLPTPPPKPESLEVKKKKEEKESGIVHANVKFFEERDTAKTPLTPHIPSASTRPAPPARSATFVAADIIRGDSRCDDYESGVDESPIVYPNLRSIAPERPTNSLSRTGRSRIRTGRCMPNSSCPHTPLRFNPPRSRDHFALLKPSRSYKSVFELTPEQEFVFFLNLAKANYIRYLDRHHESRIDASRKKENMPTANGDVHAAKKIPTRLPAPSKRSSSAHGPATPLKSPGIPKSLPKTPDSPGAEKPLIKKVPMNKIQVGAAPSPNLKAVRSKIGSLANTTHKPGGGNVKIESHKVDFSKAQPRIAAKNDTYAPGGGDKKIQQVKLQWSAKSKIGSLENAQHKPGGGDKKIETVKLDFKDKAKPKVGSKDNVKHVPGGGAVKYCGSPMEWKSMEIESQKLEFKAQSKVGSLDNVKHKPGGGDVKIFDDKTYLKQISCGSSEGRASGTQSYCDLSIISEVHSVSAPGTPHRGTAIKIKKSTTLARTRPGLRKTTEVTVVSSRSPSEDRKSLPKSASMHEVKLTYAKVATPNRGLDNVGPVEVIKVPANENAAIFKPDESPIEIKNLISNFEQQMTSRKSLPIAHDARGCAKTRPETHQSASELNEELSQKFGAVKEELDRVNTERAGDEETPASKFIKNEIAAHEKVGEIWKEVHNINPDKPKPEEGQPPPPPPTPSIAQRPLTQQSVRMRAPLPQQMPPAPRPIIPQQQQFNVQRPQQRAPFPQMAPPPRQPYPELGAGIQPIRPQQPPMSPSSPNLPQ